MLKPFSTPLFFMFFCFSFPDLVSESADDLDKEQTHPIALPRAPFESNRPLDDGGMSKEMEMKRLKLSLTVLFYN